MSLCFTLFDTVKDGLILYPLTYCTGIKFLYTLLNLAIATGLTSGGSSTRLMAHPELEIILINKICCMLTHCSIYLIDVTKYAYVHCHMLRI